MTALYALRDPFNYATVDVVFDGNLLTGSQPTVRFLGRFNFVTGRARLIWTAPGTRVSNHLFLPSRRGLGIPPGAAYIQYVGGDPLMKDYLGRPIDAFLVPINPI